MQCRSITIKCYEHLNIDEAVSCSLAKALTFSEPNLNLIYSKHIEIPQETSFAYKTTETLEKEKSEEVPTQEYIPLDKVRERVFKKTYSKILSSIQLGIKRSNSNLSEHPLRDILMVDFMTVESTKFTLLDDPTNDSTQGTEFTFKTYAPEAFRYFRDLFHIRSDRFLSSFCNEPLVELLNAGSSGSLFYVTQDD